MPREVLRYRDYQIENTKVLRARYDIYNYLPKKEDGISFMEIGTGSGDFTEHICSNVLVKDLTILDTFEGYRDHLGRHGDSGDDQLNFVKQRFENKTNLRIIEGDSFVELRELYESNPDLKYDFIYIDADHSFRGSYSDITWASKMLADGGIIGIDDYCFKPSGQLHGDDAYEVQESLSLFMDKNPEWEIKYFSFNAKGFQNVFISRIKH